MQKGNVHLNDVIFLPKQTEVIHRQSSSGTNGHDISSSFPPNWWISGPHILTFLESPCGELQALKILWVKSSKQPKSASQKFRGGYAGLWNKDAIWTLCENFTKIGLVNLELQDGKVPTLCYGRANGLRLCS